MTGQEVKHKNEGKNKEDMIRQKKRARQGGIITELIQVFPHFFFIVSTYKLFLLHITESPSRPLQLITFRPTPDVRVYASFSSFSFFYYFNVHICYYILPCQCSVSFNSLPFVPNQI